jgi:hypothetical protein
MTAEASSSDAISERTEVLHGEQNVVNTVLQFTSRAKSRIDACVDYTRPLGPLNSQFELFFPVLKP